MIYQPTNMFLSPAEFNALPIADRRHVIYFTSAEAQLRYHNAATYEERRSINTLIYFARQEYPASWQKYYGYYLAADFQVRTDEFVLKPSPIAPPQRWG